MQYPNFSRLFEDGKEIDSEYGTITLRRHEAGDLTVTSGSLVACDPAAALEAEPFTLAVAPGRYPLTLSVAHFEDNDRRVAGAMLRIGEREAVSWQLALLPGEDPVELKEEEIFGYPVDSATGCLMDEGAAQIFIDRLEKDEDFFDEIGDELEKTYVDTWAWANVVLDEASGLNMIVFSTGMGDGLYASYFGFDAGGEVVCLVTDFSLFEHEELS